VLFGVLIQLTLLLQVFLLDMLQIRGKNTLIPRVSLFLEELET
jgi:hypothetical protein